MLVGFVCDEIEGVVRKVSPFAVTVTARLGVDDVEAGLPSKVLQVLYPDPK